MTEQEKQLLLKDLCARLPYKVKGMVETTDGNGKEIKDEGVLNSVFINEYGKAYICIEGMEYELDDFKPYLRPMSDMTEDEKGQYNIIKCSICPDDADDYAGFVDWLNEHHLDYRELIPMGLALEAPEGMYS